MDTISIIGILGYQKRVCDFLALNHFGAETFCRRDVLAAIFFFQPNLTATGNNPNRNR